MTIGFTCDPSFAPELVKLAMNEVERMQIEGPSEEDTNSVKEIMRRNVEILMEENSFWLEMLLSAHMSRFLPNDPSLAFQRWKDVRDEVCFHFG